MLNINMSVGCVREGTGEGKLITSPDDGYAVLSEYASANKEMFFERKHIGNLLGDCR